MMDEPIKALVIDDEESIRSVMVKILEAEGLVVDTARNGKQAIEKSKVNFYHLAFIDIKLPDVEGIELLTTLNNKRPNMIKIIITGHPSLQNAIRAVNKGADAYIVKPFNVENILSIVREQLRKQKETKKYSQEKVTEFIESRVRELEAANQRNI
ncbi:MAG: response regulator [Candidatus Bathyarchaeota archaeon]|nr:MAG: response regulator [Candidatus Bathyarchaeota archaeon]